MSTIHLSPYVNFQGQAREAMEFYHQALGGTLDLRTMSAQGVSTPACPGDRITHARLQAEGAVIVGSDGHPNFPPTTGDNMAIALSGTDKDRLSTIFSALAEGGHIKMPLSERSGGAVGFLVDKFGINWTVSVDKA